MAFIEIVRPDAAEGKLKDVYEEISRSRGGIAEVHQVSSLHPELMEGHLDLYMRLMYGRGGLTRRERELVATAVSRFNDCDYCITHHKEALERYEKDDALVARIEADPEQAGLPERDRALVAYAAKLTRTPGEVTQEDVDGLRAHGFTDRDILAAAAVTAYFNFVNRLVLGLGVHLEDVAEREYKY